MRTANVNPSHHSRQISTFARPASLPASRGVDSLIVSLVTISFASFLLGGPLFSYMAYVLGQTNVEKMSILLRIYAAAYGLPLLCGAALSVLADRPGERFRGHGVLDVWIGIMAVYWCGQSFHGLSRGNLFGYIISDSFNFQVPVLTYLCMRRLQNSPRLDSLVRSFTRISILAIGLNLFIVLTILGQTTVTSAGAVYQLLPVAVGIALFSTRGTAKNAALLLLATATVVLSLKRACWGGLVLLPVVFCIIDRQYSRALKLFVGLALCGTVLYALGDRLPQQISPQRIVSRFDSIASTTDNFSRGQAREDEFRSIVDTISEGGTSHTLFGLGMGATYTYFMESTHQYAIANYHDAHFTPIAWTLRGGCFGMAINVLFYGTAVLQLVRTSRLQTIVHRRVWCCALAAYFSIAVILSAFAFNLTPNPTTHMIMMIVLLQGSPRRE